MDKNKITSNFDILYHKFFKELEWNKHAILGK